MTQILSGVKVQGQTSGGTAIGTVTINYNSDGTWDFVGTAGNVHIYSGKNPEVNKLLELMFVGSGGLPTGTKLFGNA